MAAQQPCDEYELIVFHETERAVLVGETLQDREKGKWLPKSQIDVGEKIGTEGEFDVVTITVPQWLAVKNGLA